MPTDRSQVVAIRLDYATWERYSAEATAKHLGLSTYLRQRLEEQDRVLAELASLRQSMEDLAAPASSGTSGGGATPGVALETLLLCRAMAQPQRVDMVQSEVRRVGLDVWEGPSPTTSRRSR
jgi:hypothetical protein